MIDTSEANAISASARNAIAVRATQPLDGALEIVGRGQSELAAAVVAARRRLETEGQTKRIGCRAQVGRRPDLAPRRDLGTGRFREASLGQAVLGHGQRHAPGPDGDDGIDRCHDIDRDVLQLVGHDIAEAREPEGRPDIVVPGDDQAIGEGRGRAVGVGVQDGDPVAHRACGKREHPPQLAASKEADGGGRGDRGAVHAEPMLDVRDPGLLLVRVLVALR